jgi:acylpyruvate hydrolase
MRLATIRTTDGLRAVRIEGDNAIEIGEPDVGALLANSGWRQHVATASGPSHPVSSLNYAPVVPQPSKIICVGLNYRNHILEMGRELPEYPTLFAKFAEALIGANDDIALAPESDMVDWEAELAVIVGAQVRRADDEQAAAAIAGFSVLNDITMRDWQYRTTEWLQGKTFEATTPLGPVLVTPDEIPGGVRPVLTMTADIDGETVQEVDTSDMVFDPVALVRYISTVCTLRPGDIIASGTPGGVGHARKPPRYLTGGAVVTTSITGIGTLRNTAHPA